MQNPFLPFLLLLFIQGVFGADETVNEGESITLQTGVTEIKNDDVIMWMFGPKDMVLCQITRKGDQTPISFTDDVIFRGRLQVDQKTGSLTIRNTRIRHSGDYKVIISREQTTNEIFKVTVKSVVNETDGVKSISVKEGESATLKTHTDLHPHDLIVWRFGDKGILLAKVDVGTNETSLNKADERFRDRLKLDQTGSLTVTNTRTEHSGLYELQIRGRESSQRFLLSVTAPGLSSGAVAGIVVVLLMFAAAAAAGVKYYKCKIPKRVKQTMETVTKGDPVTLKPVTEINKGDQIQLIKTSGDKDTLIAEIKGGREEIIPDERFKDRLEVDKKTGSFTITDTRTEDSGLYKILIRRGIRTLYEEFYISVTVKTVSVTEGDSVTLNTDVTEVQGDDLIEWRFGDKGSLIAEIRGGRVFIYDTGLDEKFLDRLELDKKTGSLTIMKTRETDTGLYELKISQDSKIKHKKLYVSVGVKTVSVFEGDPVTLETDTEIQRDDIIEWRFGIEGPLLAQIRGVGIISINHNVPDGRFSAGLELDEKTGSLTITNTEMKRAGVYHLQITSISGVSCKTFRVAVRDVRIISVTEGKNVILNPETEIQKDDQIEWRFGDKDIPIAEIRGGTGKTRDVDDDGRFGGRLRLDEKTGSLIITDITAEQSGDYKLEIISSRGTTHKTFKAVVLKRNRVNDSATVEIPLLNEEDLDAGNEHEGMSLLVMR